MSRQGVNTRTFPKKNWSFFDDIKYYRIEPNDIPGPSRWIYKKIHKSTPHPDVGQVIVIKAVRYEITQVNRIYPSSELRSTAEEEGPFPIQSSINCGYVTLCPILPSSEEEP